MFNKDGIFGRKPEDERNEPRPLNVKVTPALNTAAAPRPSAAQPDPLRFDRAAAESPKAPQLQEEPAGSKLIVGPDIKLKGVEITDCDTLVVEGRVEASMDSRVVQIAEAGVFSGTATMDVAEIWGTFQGQLTVRKHLVIYATGRVSGEIRYGKIEIAEGGELSGTVSTLASASAQAPRAAPQRAETPPPRIETPPAPAASPLKGTPTSPASQSPVRSGAAAAR